MLVYDYVENMLERRIPYLDRHRARVREQMDAGRIVQAGALGDPPHGGALVWRGVEEAEIEAFARADPYMEAGLITDWRVSKWNLI